MTMLAKYVRQSLLKGKKLHTITTVRCLNTEGTHMKTELQFPTLNDESNHLYIHAFSSMGFTLNSGTRVFGPIAVFPKNILHWNVKNAASITNEALSLFPLLVPKLDIVVIGVGDRGSSISNTAYRYLKSHNINVEMLPTEIACPTFNFLNLERRNVAAGLIPPFEDVKIIPSKSDYHFNRVISGFQEEDLTLDDLKNKSGQSLESAQGQKPSLQQKFRDYVQNEDKQETEKMKKTDNDSTEEDKKS